MNLWGKIRSWSGIDGKEPGEEICEGLYQENRKLYSCFHFFIFFFELCMLISIFLQSGGSFTRSRRAAYVILYLLLMAVTAAVTLWQRRTDHASEGWVRRYFRVENSYFVFLCFWGTAVTLNDQLGGSGISVYVYTLLIAAVLSFIKPWKMALVFGACWAAFNFFRPYFPSPAGLDHSYDLFINSLFLTLAALIVSANLYHARIGAKSGELDLRRLYQKAKERNIGLQEEAYSDTLTRVRNRNAYFSAMEELRGRQLSSFACVYIDVNGLHELNNHLGHEAGDTMLRTVASILKNHFRASEVFRVGGDEFVILCPDIPEEVLQHRVKHIRGQVAAAGYAVSIGLEWRKKEIDAEDIVQAAEERMKKDKSEYYASGGDKRQMRMLNEQMENLLAEKEDAETFLAMLSSLFKGVYFVNLDTDKVRSLYIPDYFRKNLEEANFRYGKALAIYSRERVKPEYWTYFDEMTDYAKMKEQLVENSMVEYFYIDQMEMRVRVQILKLGNAGWETLWVFADIDKPIIDATHSGVKVKGRRR